MVRINIKGISGLKSVWVFSNGEKILVWSGYLLGVWVCSFSKHLVHHEALSGGGQPPGDGVPVLCFLLFNDLGVIPYGS
jgi:hypothetical protein